MALAFYAPVLFVKDIKRSAISTAERTGIAEEVVKEMIGNPSL